MIPKRVLLENFLSFGGTATEFHFDDDEPLWVLCGPNGVGKSSVFDAITYSLFGCHRGGNAIEMDKLIRHGENGFRVEFDFRFAGADYRIQRNYGKKSLDRVFHRVAESWVEIELPTKRHKVREWVQEKIGLTYDQFTASVLLKQGQADLIITADGKDRLEMLKKILGVQRYQQLADQVKAEAKSQKQRHELLRGQLAQCPDISDEALSAAQQADELAAAELDAAHHAETQATLRIEQARQYAELLKSLDRVRLQLAQAQSRQDRAADILTQYQRFTELDRVVPVLTQLVRFNTQLEILLPQINQLKEDGQLQQEQLDTTRAKLSQVLDDKLQHEQQKIQWNQQIGEHEVARKEQQRLLAVAEAIRDIDQQLSQWPRDLAAQAETAAESVQQSEARLTQAVQHLSAVHALLLQLEQQLQSFRSVEIGVACSRCGQAVTAEHAQSEKERLEQAILQQKTDYDLAQQSERNATVALIAARSQEQALRASLGRQNQLLARRSGLTTGQEIPQVSTIQAQLHKLDSDGERLALNLREAEAKVQSLLQEAKKLQTQVRDYEQSVSEANQSLRNLEQQWSVAQAQKNTLEESLPDDWANRWPSFQAGAVQKLQDELDELTRLDIAQQHQLYQRDLTLQSEWQSNLAETEARIEQLPVESRVAVTEAEKWAEDCRRTTRTALQKSQVAASARQELIQARERRAELASQEREAEQVARVHARLDGLLGSDGLLRDLVRTAEQQIVRFANETVQNLSDGLLTIELDEGEEGPDKAFTLKVGVGGSEPVPVRFLSGSQKFRVAVAVALAIGRFATSGTQAKPLESVIIDEGFGSLDQDGLRCMAEELTRLADRAGLKRIILVSHQEQFVKSFPIGWKLSPSANGTIATPFRR